MSNEYVLTENTKRLLQKKGYKLHCARCNKPIKAGETVVSRIRNASRQGYKV